MLRIQKIKRKNKTKLGKIQRKRKKETSAKQKKQDKLTEYTRVTYILNSRIAVAEKASGGAVYFVALWDNFFKSQGKKPHPFPYIPIFHNF